MICLCHGFIEANEELFFVYLQNKSQGILGQKYRSHILITNLGHFGISLISDRDILITAVITVLEDFRAAQYIVYKQKQKNEELFRQSSFKKIKRKSTKIDKCCTFEFNFYSVSGFNPVL